MRAGAERDFAAFVAVHGTAFLRLAVLLCRDASDAEDLLQDVLEKAYRRWTVVSATDHPTAYVRRMLASRAVDRWRLRRLVEVPLMNSHDAPGIDRGDAHELRDALLRGLRALPARQRAAVVLRHCEDLSEVEVAALLGCSVGTVKSQTSRGLVRLRELLGPELAATLVGGTP